MRCEKEMSSGRRLNERARKMRSDYKGEKLWERWENRRTEE